jgi:hypothetical protein
MSKNDVSQVLERVRTWPEERQEEAAHVLLEMEAQDTSPYWLTDEQLAEVRRRRANDDPKLVSLAPALSFIPIRRDGDFRPTGRLVDKWGLTSLLLKVFNGRVDCTEKPKRSFFIRL